MCEKLISTGHIQKLGHKIAEIRERALYNIISKLDHGFVFDNDLARTKEILTRLLEWFLFEPCAHHEAVFLLLKRILKSDSGRTLIQHQGTASLLKELGQIRSYIEPKYHPHLDEICELLRDYKVVVPRLESDVPLSYRTGEDADFNVGELDREVIGSSASPIEGFVYKDPSPDQQTCPTYTSRPLDPPGPINNNNTVVNYLKWQHLIESDLHVLNSIEDSLTCPPEPSALLHSSDFFRNILLHDFPAEIFLQRPNIVLRFYELLNTCPSTRVKDSILNGLIDLTRSLQVRINYQNDPSLYTLKDNVSSAQSSRCGTPDSIGVRRAASGQSNENDTRENLQLLRSNQISIPTFCFRSFGVIFKLLVDSNVTITSRQRNQRAHNLSLSLLDELVKLISLALIKPHHIWNVIDKNNEMQRQLRETLAQFGEVLDFFRLESLTTDDSMLRSVHLLVLHNFTNFLSRIVPMSQSGLILPKNVKVAISNSLIDVALFKLYPEVHRILLEYVDSFSIGLDKDCLLKYEETDRICKSMVSAIAFMQNYKNLDPIDGVTLLIHGVPCLEFHNDLTFVHKAIELCSSQLSLYQFDNDRDICGQFESAILKLLAHNVDEIKEETYKLCHKKIIATIGTKLNENCTGAPGSQILFLLSGKIIAEIAAHGLTSQSGQIAKHSEDILVHIIKSKILVSDNVWNKIVVALIYAFPILMCHASNSSCLGRALLNVVDPDVAKGLLLPQIEVCKANMVALFNTESVMREEAFSRLCWLLSSQRNSKDMLPRLNNLYDRALPNVCINQRLVDINKTHKGGVQFYQASSLQQVLQLLQSPRVEPVIRRSAITQLSVMLEDPLLHSTFLQSDGLNLILDTMKSALIENNYSDYPDSVIPCVSLLKSLCLYDAGTRVELGSNQEVLFNVLRSLFVFFTEDRLKQDAACLLFLVLFGDFVEGSPSKGDLSLPDLVVVKLNVPFLSHSHWKRSPYCEESRKTLLTPDKWCMSALQIQWNSEIVGGFKQLLLSPQIKNNKLDNVSNLLKMKDYDLQSLKASSMNCCIVKYLKDVQKGLSHDAVITSISKLTTYVHLYGLANSIDKTKPDFSGSLWESTFVRFLKSLPSSEDDAKLLGQVLKFLTLLASSPGVDLTWLPNFLKNPANCLLDLITIDTTSSDDYKVLSQHLLHLIKTCCQQELHFLDFYNTQSIIDQGTTWIEVIKLIADSLKFSDATHFYNLAYLDSLLSCLVHLTAFLRWSHDNIKINRQLVGSLCDLVVVFHCGKGPTASVSLMGLSITRNAVLVLNNLIAEIHYNAAKIKNWEEWFLDLEELNWISSLALLWSSRDVVVRAAGLQLFAGLAVSPKISCEIAKEFQNNTRGVWTVALNILLDNNEACVVRENCALLLSNLTCLNNREKLALVWSTCVKKDSDDVTTLINVLEDYQFFVKIQTILSCSYTNDLCNNSVSTNSTTSASNSISINTTPSLVKSTAILLNKLLNLDSNKVTVKLQDYGLPKQIFGCICNPAMNVQDTRELALYCEILEMNTAICALLSQLISASDVCLGTVLHTRDCFTTLISLLNLNKYETHFPQLLYLRNNLLSQVFRLLTTLFNTTDQKQNHREDSLQIIVETLIECQCSRFFFGTIGESIKSSDFDVMQNSALLFLTSFLQSENHAQGTLRHLLDDNGQNSSLGANLCDILLNLYDLTILKLCASDESLDSNRSKKKSSVVSTLSAILSVSQDAKRIAYNNGLLHKLISQLKVFHEQLSLKSVDCLRRVTEKKTLSPLLIDLNELIGLLTNFIMRDDGAIKTKATQMGLCDLVHKLWVWFCVDKNHLANVLRMLWNLTTECPNACQSLPLTSCVAGTALRKNPTKISLVHALINLIEKEMEFVSKTHDLGVLELSFGILDNCCCSSEIRAIICKSTLLNSMTRLHPANTKKRKPWEEVEEMWMEFLQAFSQYPEGQSCIAKVNDVFELLIILTSTSRAPNLALLVLRNVAFYQPNRIRLLTSDDFLQVLTNKLDVGLYEEKMTVVLILWALVANNQKAKLLFKSAHIDNKLDLFFRHCQLSGDTRHQEDINNILYVLRLIRDGEKTM